MSRFDRERIEAAVRAWDREPCTDYTFAMFTAMDAPIGFWRPDGTDDSAEFSVGACAEWLRHVRAIDAAKPAPAVEPDPLAGVVWDDAAKVVAWGDAVASWRRGAIDSDKRVSLWYDISTRDMGRIRDADGLIDKSGHGAVITHARAQLAREAAATAPTHTDLMVPPEAIDSWLEQNPLPVEAAHIDTHTVTCIGCGESLPMMNGGYHVCAPAQPAALTLEQARAMCREAGDTVVEAPPRPNYVKPAEMLAWFEASVAVRKAEKHMGDAASRCAMQDRDAWTETPDECTVESEIARLRALGVTPAVLS